jgi:DNA-directed RNA polymerase I subunit RPA43
MGEVTKKRKLDGGGPDEDIENTSSKKRRFSSSSEDISECFHKVSTSLYVSLAPMYLNNPIAGIQAQHLDPLLMTFFPAAGGVVLAHYNLKLSGQSKYPSSGDMVAAKVMYDSPFAFMWVSVDLLIWMPRPGDVVEGWINMQSPSHIGLLIHDIFNASIKRDAIPRDWQFVPNQEDEEPIGENGEDSNVEKMLRDSRSMGYWVDGQGKRIDDKLRFTVKVFNVSGRTVSVQGSLLKPGAVREDLTKPDATVDLAAVAKHVTFEDTVDGTEANEGSGSSEGYEDIDKKQDDDEDDEDEDNEFA